jgi:hypothetical protein
MQSTDERYGLSHPERATGLSVTRVIVTRAVSKMGNINSKVGTMIIAKTLDACVRRAIAIVANRNPRNKLPLSPINIFAGGKLKKKS